MPLPSQMEFTGDSLVIVPEFGVIFTGESSAKLEKAVSRFKARLSYLAGIDFDGGGDHASELIIINKQAGNPIPIGDEDESYELTITGSEIQLRSNSDYGAIHGLETVLQLVEGNKIPKLKLKDNPRFVWRGLMIDVSRHWMPKPVILRNLDAMAALKMNVLHLHLSDDQGFRVESNSFPGLHEVGSNGKYFTQEEVKEIIQYAADRGIRIIPEFDVPGHTKSWLIAYPELASVERNFTWGQDRSGGLFTVPMDPTREETYEFLDEFFGEMADLFPDPYMHIGGDEVNPYYWEENPRIREFMNENDMENAHDLQAYFNRRMSEILAAHGKKMIGWEEILNPALPENTIIQSWKGQKSLFEAIHAGYYGVLSAGWYLDHKLHAGEHYTVDPMVMPGAIQIEPDLSHWRMYDLTLDIPGGKIDTQLVLFDRDPENVFGYFAFMDQRSAFTGGTFQADQLSFDFEAGNVGELSFDADGYISGGHDMPGTEMPEIEIVEPLHETEKERILGGEAAMWAEVVSAQTVDSRIWPRTAAIAEKLWSPANLTKDVDDMYRRLEIVSRYLDKIGLRHQAYQDPLLREIGGEAYESLKELVSILEEAKYYNRHGFLINLGETYLPDVELNYVADAALPESMEAREFNRLVESYYEDSSDDKRKEILSNLRTWSSLHGQLSPHFDGLEKLREVEELSMRLAEVSKMAIQKLNGDEAAFNVEEIEENLVFLEQGENGVVVAVVPGLRRILVE